MSDIVENAEKIVRTLCGEPDRINKAKSEWIYKGGDYGGLKVNIKNGVWFDHDLHEGGELIKLVCLKKGLQNGAAYEWLRDTLGIQFGKKIEAVYTYTDENDRPLFEAVRFDTPIKSEKFRQRNLNGGWSIDGIRRVLFHLPALIKGVAAGKTVFICEGEKDTLNVEKLGFVATCNPMGAKKWRGEYSEFLRGAACIILADNDPAGRNHVRIVVPALTGIAGSVQVLDLPGLALHGDVSNWIGDGGTAEQLEARAGAAPSGVAWIATHGAELEQEDDKKNARKPEPEYEPGAYEHDERPEYDDNIRPPQFSEDALALAFADQHARELRYVVTWGQWRLWTGNHWREDNMLHGYDRARALCRLASTSDELTEKQKKDITKASTVAAIERMARSDRRIVASVEQWDADPYLLGTPGGTVDLRTGALRPANPVDYITKAAAVSPAPPGTPCPLWEQFLRDVMHDDRSLIDYLQRVSGYALTGCTIEHQLWFLYGTGRNGKGVFIDTISGIMGDYATTASMETFVETKNQQHPADLAMLRGARLVTAQETEEGRRWAEARIKALTGGDPITARFMRENFFTYQPQFKLLVAGNHKPGLRGVDEAMRARLSLVPFTVTIPVERRDKRLKERLKAEWPAILRWMINGCLAWQKDGLKPPEAVTAASDAYFDQQDSLAMWLDERTENGKPDENALSSVLYQSWRAWAEARNEFVGTNKRFSEAMEARGYRKNKTMAGAAFYAIKLKQVEARQEDVRSSRYPDA